MSPERSRIRKCSEWVPRTVLSLHSAWRRWAKHFNSLSTPFSSESSNILDLHMAVARTTRPKAFICTRTAATQSRAVSGDAFCTIHTCPFHLQIVLSTGNSEVVQLHRSALSNLWTIPRVLVRWHRWKWVSFKHTSINGILHWLWDDEITKVRMSKRFTSRRYSFLRQNLSIVSISSNWG